MQPQQPNFGPLPPQAPIPNYDFITNPGQRPKRRLSLPGNRSTTRIIVILLVLMVVVIIIGIIKNAASGPGNANAFITVAQDQQELIHLTTNASNDSSGGSGQINLSADNQNFAISAELVLSSEQSQLLGHLADNGHKVSTTKLDIKQSSATDNELTQAGQVNNYDQVFAQVMKSQLDNYSTDLQTAYKLTPDAPGQQLLNGDYKGAQLLLKQLLSPAS